jgi:selenide,water dikinase
LRALPFAPDPNLLVGLEHPDDAAVVRLSDDVAIVFTTDFFTPIVDEPRAFGRIAAANALSDVYAMGAQPLVALNIAAFPSKTLPLSLLGEILLGGAEIAREAGITIAGGHTIDDPEPKYGLAVVGTVHPARVWRKGGAQPGDALVLTKALGTGILSTALKRERVQESDPAVQTMVASMTTLNAGAARIAHARQLSVHAATDVTGYGLAGHLLEMLRGSEGVGATLDTQSFAALPLALELAREGLLAGGTRANRDHVGAMLEVSPGVPEELAWLACDAQTSGGLLFAVPASEAPGFVEALQREAGLSSARQIGRIEPRDVPSVRLE